ncbi:MAG: hypothetical protein AB7D03_08715 [Thiomicrospira sp.]
MRTCDDNELWAYKIIPDTSVHQRVQPGYVAVIEPLGDGLFDLIAIEVFE